jgi:hypothetical protein
LDGAEPRHRTILESAFRVLFSLHCNDRNPLAISFFVIGNRPTKTLGNIFRQQIAMVAKEFFFDALPRIPMFEKRMRWLVLGGED